MASQSETTKQVFQAINGLACELNVQHRPIIEDLLAALKYGGVSGAIVLQAMKEEISKTTVKFSDIVNNEWIKSGEFINKHRININMTQY